MSRKILILALLTLMPVLAGAGEKTQYGESLTEGLEPTPIETILADPQSWVGKKVQIAGEISGIWALSWGSPVVCASRSTTG